MMLKTNSNFIISGLFLIVMLQVSSCTISNGSESTPVGLPSQQSLAPTIQPVGETSASILSTLDEHASKLRIEELMKTNDGCRFPCWWGINPGETNYSDARMDLEGFTTLLSSSSAVDDDQYSGAHYFFPDNGPVDGDFGSVYLLAKEDIVVALTIDGYETISNYYNIHSVLQSYGLPSKIWIYTLRDSYGEGFLPFIVALDYSISGFLIYYQGNGAVLKKQFS